MKTQSFLLLLPLLVSFPLIDGTSAAGHNRKPVLVGGWQPIKDVKDPNVQEIAQFAISEHNKTAMTDLKYEKVVRGETQVVAGTNYRLVIAAKDGGVSKNYQAVVYERIWEGYRNLTSFKQV